MCPLSWSLVGAPGGCLPFTQPLVCSTGLSVPGSSQVERLVPPGAGASVSPTVRPSQWRVCLRRLASVQPHPVFLAAVAHGLCPSLLLRATCAWRKQDRCLFAPCPPRIAARWGGGTSAVKSCLSDLFPTTHALPGSAGKDSLASGCLGGPSVPQNSQTQALTSVQSRRVAAVQTGALLGTHACTWWSERGASLLSSPGRTGILLGALGQ